MRILWWSNHPTAPTGYGQQTALWCRQLAAAGHDVVISANYAGEARAHYWEGLPVFPPGEHPYAQDSLGEDVLAIEPDLTWLLYDAWVLEAKLEGRVACWTPVDHSPVPPKVLHKLRETGATAVAMSQWGQRQLIGNGIRALYVPHGIDTDIYQPQDRTEARRRLGLDPDAFLVGMVAANKGQYFLRKGFDVAFQAFAWLARQYDDAQLYVHARPESPHGIDLKVCARNYEVPADRLTFANPALLRYGISDQAMAWIYSAFDVLLAPSLGEGFGIPVLEAQACGVPVIVTNATAQTELCGAGWKCDGDWLYDSTQAADWVRPFAFEVKRALADARLARDDTELAVDAIEFAVGYDYRKVWAEHMAPTLDALVPSMEPIRL
jgi:glycosyltransferase involved in cell wall biosynthesis